MSKYTRFLNPFRNVSILEEILVNIIKPYRVNTLIDK